MKLKEVINSFIELGDKVIEQEEEIERLNSIIKEQDKELELERKSRQLLTDDLANVCKILLKKDNIIKEVRDKINKNYWWNWDTDNDKIIREILEIINKVEGKK